MNIKSIHLLNYRCYADLEVEFKAGFNVIVGVNGSGKTSLLKAICDALASIDYLSLLLVSYQTLGDTNSVRLKTESFQGRYRFEPQYPVKVTTLADAFNTECNWTVQ